MADDTPAEHPLLYSGISFPSSRSSRSRYSIGKKDGNGGSKVGLFDEIGRTGLRSWGGYVVEEWLGELQGRRGAELYREMSDSDPIIGGILFVTEMLVRQVDWWVEPASDQNADLLAQDFLQQCLFEDMSTSWNDCVSEILSMLPYGYAYFETLFKRRGGDVRDPTRRSKFTDGKIGLRKLASRSQDSLLHWDFDDNGGILAMVQQPPPTYSTYTIPIEKALLFRTKITKNNPEGRSVLRNCVKPYYFLKNLQALEGIGIERDLAGLPTLTPPPGVNIWNTKDPEMVALLGQAQAMVSQVRRDELEGVVVPHGWEFALLQGAGKRQLDVHQVITRYEQRMAMSLVADFIMLGQDKVGSYALAGTKKTVFSAALEAHLDQIASVFNTYLTPRLFKLNGWQGLSDYPKLCHGVVEDIDLETLAVLLTALGAAGAPVFAGDKEDKLLNAILGKAGLPATSADDTSEGE